MLGHGQHAQPNQPWSNMDEGVHSQQHWTIAHMVNHSHL